MQPATSADTLSQLQTAQSQAQNPNDVLAAQRASLGVNAANDSVTGLRGAINNTTKLLSQVAPSVMGRTANSLVTSAQANRQVANESAPISQTLSDQTGKYNQASQDAAKLEGEAELSAGNVTKGQQDKVSYLQNLYNALYGKEQDAVKQAEATREFNVSQANENARSAASRAATTNPAAGYSVKQLSSGNKAYTGPNGQTNLYQYASAIAGGDPQSTFTEIMRQLASGSATDKGAYNAVQKLPMDQAIAYLQKHNAYIFR